MTPTGKPATPAKKAPATSAPTKKDAPARRASAGKKADAADPVHAALDQAIFELSAGERTWRALSIAQRVTLLRAVRRNVGALAAEWADTAAAAKGLTAGHPLRGEEWMSGPYAVLGALDAYIATLNRIAQGRNPLDGITIDRAPGGRTRIHAFPLSADDRMLLAGFSGEVWLEPGVTPSAARAKAGLGQRTPAASGGVGLVLGAGNVTSIPVLDVLYELLAHNRVALLKLNPTQDVLKSVFERALAPLAEPGLVRVVSGDGAVGAYLTAHKGFSHVHITGSEATFDAIVWGPAKGAGSAATKKRRAEGKPRLATPITAELGGVSPIIVVPGEWTQADLDYQAEHIATMRLQNCGHNCIAGQVVLVSEDWPQRAAFLAALRRAYALAPERPIWYPGSADRMAQAAASYPDALELADRLLIEADAADAADLQSTEYFAPVLGVVSLPGSGQAFLDAAVTHANEKLHGTLGANLIVDPGTEKALGAGLERAIAQLRYGSIAVNTWTALGFVTPTLTWGAFPGNTPDRVGSGLGVVHNALLLDDVERSVVRGPFREFPRSLTGGRRTILPKPPWFVTSRTGAAVSEGLTRFRVDRRIPGLLKTLAQAMRA